MAESESKIVSIWAKVEELGREINEEIGKYTLVLYFLLSMILFYGMESSNLALGYSDFVRPTGLV